MRNLVRLVIMLAFLGVGVQEGQGKEEEGVTFPVTKRVHYATKAGSWYPRDPQKLTTLLDDLLAQAATSASIPAKGPIRAIIVPHAGYAYSGKVAAAAFRRLKGATFKRVVVLGPAHTMMFAGLSIPDTTHEATLLGEIPLDLAAMETLLRHPMVNTIPRAHEREHSIEMELPFLQRTLAPGWQLVPVLVGQLNREGFRRAAEGLRPLLDEKTLLVISGDFTHYGVSYRYVPFPQDEQIAKRLRDLDMGAVEQILSRQPDRFIAYKNKTGITACIFGPATLLMHLLGPQTEHAMIQYETSGSQGDDFGLSVSYIAMLFTDPNPLNRAQAEASSLQKLSSEDMALLHKMARHALSLATRHGAQAVSADVIAKAFDMPDHFRRPAGAFVTLKREETLRGCIGFIQPIKPLYQAVVENAVNAALRDSRFRPVTSHELAGLDVEVSVLTPTQPIDSPNDFEVGQHGIILKKGRRQAVFLPEVAVEQGWNREQTLRQLSLKAGLPPDAWKEGAQFEIFVSQKYTAPYP